MRHESEADRAVARLLRQQGGVITRAQVLATGWSEGTLRHRIRPGGPWATVLPGIYLGSNGPIADGQREIAAVLYAGPGCVITGPASLRQQGVRVPATGMVDVLIPAPAKRRGEGFVRLHQTKRMPEQVFVLNGIRWAPAARANPDLYTVSGFLARPDLWWKDAGVAGEVDSREWHLSPEQSEMTMARHSRMTAHGIFVLHFTPRQIKTEPRRIVAEFRSAIEEGRRRPSLSIRTVPHA